MPRNLRGPRRIWGIVAQRQPTPQSAKPWRLKTAGLRLIGVNLRSLNSTEPEKRAQSRGPPSGRGPCVRLYTLDFRLSTLDFSVPQLPRVAIIGRPNVGKSTLFNRICGRRRALVGDEPGMTRDRLYAPAAWLGKPFEVVDTGGMLPFEKDLIATEILRQAQVAIEEAAQLILVVDARQGIVPLDEELVQLLRRAGKPLSLAVNKVDMAQHSPLAAEFHRLGVPDIFPLSAEHGLGVDDLLEHVTRDFPASGEETEEPGPKLTSTDGPRTAAATINVGIIGRPNVGKSTLLNSLLEQERSIVSPLPGTTRDAGMRNSNAMAGASA